MSRLTSILKMKIQIKSEEGIFMDVMMTLTLRQLKKRKRRTFGIMLGIASVSLFLTMVSLFIHSYFEELYQLQLEPNYVKPLIAAASVVLAVILSSLTLFVYHVLSLSSTESIRQLGILGSVGATPQQRGRISLYESLIFCVVSIPAGVCLGILISDLLFPFPIKISWKILGCLLGTETIVILMTGLIQAFFSSRKSIISLLSNRTEKRDLNNRSRVPQFLSRYLSFEGQLAIKNVYFFKKRYLAIGITFIISIILLLDGFIYLNYIDGSYAPKDPRSFTYNDISIIEQTYVDGEKTVRPEKNWKDFAEEIISLDGVEEAVIKEEINLGSVLFDSQNIKTEMDRFTTFESIGKYENPVVLNGNNKETRQGYYMNLSVTGMDDKAFNKYLNQVTDENTMDLDSVAIPVIIDDTALIRQGGKSEYKGIFNLKNGDVFSVYGDKDRTHFGADSSVNKVVEFVKYPFQVLAVTDELPSCYGHFDKLSSSPNEIHFYTSQSGLERLYKHYAQSTLEELALDASRSVSITVKSDMKLPTRIIFPAVIQNKGGNEYFNVYKLESEYLDNPKSAQNLLKSVKKRNADVQIIEEEIREIGRDNYGMTDGKSIDYRDEDYYKQMDYYIDSYLTHVEIALTDTFPLLRRILVYTLFLFLTIIGVFQMGKTIFVSVNMRRGEFAVLLSLGMEKRKILKMICIENIATLIFSYLIGEIISTVGGMILFQVWTKTQALEIIFPYKLLIWEMEFLILLIIFSILVSIWSIRKLNVADLLKADML